MNIVTVDGQAVEWRDRPLWWHTAGKQQTASNYGRRLTTSIEVRWNGRWRRVYTCCYSNAGTSYIDDRTAPRRENGRYPWLIVNAY